MTNWLNFYLRARGFLRRTVVAITAALIIATAVIAIGVALDRQNSTSYRERSLADADRTAFMLQQRLSGQIKADMTTASHIARDFAIDPDEAMLNFDRQARLILSGDDHIVRIAVAPAFTLARLHPAAPEDGAEGPRDLAGRYPEAPDRVRRLLANLNKGLPAFLEHGREAFTLFYPVVQDGPEGTMKVWGAIELTLSKPHFFSAAGFTVSTGAGPQSLLELDDMRLAIRDVSGRGDGVRPSLFFGNPATLQAEPLSKRLPFSGGAWEILVAPAAGWDIPCSSAASFRVALGLMGFAVVIPIFIASLLIAERNRNIAALKAREAKLLELSQRFNLAMESSNIGIWEMQDGSDQLYWDERASQLHGGLPVETLSPLDEWLATVLPEDRQAVRAYFRDHKLTGCTYKVQYRIRLDDGTIRCLRTVGTRYESNGASTRTTGIVWDVTADEMLTQTLRDAKEVSEIKNAELELALDELSSREQELEDLSRKLDLALESYRCGIWEASLEDGTEVWDARMCQLYGVPPGKSKITRQEWLAIVHPEDRETALANHRTLVGGSMPEPLVTRIVLPDGSIRYTRSIGQLHIGRDGTRKLVGIAVDVTEDAIMTAELKAAKEETDAKNAELELAKSRIEHNALHDPLTGLANRRKLDMELERLSQESTRSRVRFSILHLDLDRFKQINDTLGHAAGDAMLAHAAKVLTANVRKDGPARRGDLVARIGGDEFVILAQGTDAQAALASLAGRIVQEMRQPVDFEGFACRCGVSIGIAQAGGTHIDARKVLINADIALYRAKRMGRNRFEFFTQNLQAEIINTKRIADEILTGIDNHEFVTWYQPQFSARTRRLTGVEALVRWDHPLRGILAPDQFLGIAEELNVVSILDQTVMQTALKDKMRWAAMGITVPKISVNVSSRRLHDEALIDALKGLSIAPGELCFELVESIFLDDREAITDVNLEQIKSLGIDIEIDDFGTGHTSIVSLLKLKPKRLKIDRQLVMPILDSSRERALVRSIIDIARSLGVETVAEGVESLDHADLLADLGCDMLQGYAFARPLSFDDFTRQSREAGWKAAS